MGFNLLNGIAEQPAKADKSAVGTVNRPLRVAGVVCQCASIDTRSTLRGLVKIPRIFLAPHSRRRWGPYGCVVLAYYTMGFLLKCVYGLLPFARYYCIMEENV